MRNEAKHRGDARRVGDGWLRSEVRLGDNKMVHITHIQTLTYTCGRNGGMRCKE